MLCQTIQTEKGQLTFNKACSLANISRHAYSDWLKPVEQKTDPLYEPILAIKKDRDCRKYGYRRVYHELKRRQIKTGKKSVLKTMQKHAFTCKKRIFRVCTTNSNHGLRTYPNLIKKLKVIKLNQVWVSDITYIRFGNGETAYLAIVMDRCSRKFLGWQLSRDINEQLCDDALEMAFKDREGIDLTGLIHHSDRGVQYASNDYTAKLEAKDILISMSRKGNPYDNAHMERAIRTIKDEEVYMDEYTDFNDAYQNLKHFIEEVYNKKRLNSAIGYLPPAEFEQKYILKEVLA